MKDDVHCGQVIRWTEKGDAIRVIDQSGLPLVLGRYFRSTNINSFKRQLTHYGFKKMGSKNMGDLCYSHPDFRHDNPSCVHTMRRVRPGQPSPSHMHPMLNEVVVAKKMATDRTEMLMIRVDLILSDHFADEYGNCVPETSEYLEDGTDMSDSERDAFYQTMDATSQSLVVAPHIERKWAPPEDEHFFAKANVGAQMLEHGFDLTSRVYNVPDVRRQPSPRHVEARVWKLLTDCTRDTSCVTG